MIKQALLSEFQHEAEGTRKLLSMIPDSALSYRPQPHLWSVAELASHIAEIYNWYDVTFNQDSFEMSGYKVSTPPTAYCRVASLFLVLFKNKTKDGFTRKNVCFGGGVSPKRLINKIVL